jgi:hypothetical protein
MNMGWSKTVVRITLASTPVSKTQASAAMLNYSSGRKRNVQRKCNHAVRRKQTKRKCRLPAVVLSRVTRRASLLSRQDRYCSRDDAAVRDRTAHDFLGVGVFLLVVAGMWALVDAFLIPGIVRGFNTALAMKFVV